MKSNTVPDGQTKKGNPGKFELFMTWLKIGVLSFGGPAAQIAMMHRLVVDEKAWMTEKQFLSGLGFCMLLPGPEAMQLATYSGWRIRGVIGGLIAGGLFVLPGALVVGLLAALYVSFGEVYWISTIFLGIKAAVVVIVIQALYRLAKKSLSTSVSVWVAVVSFVGIFFINLPFPLIVLSAGLLGMYLSVSDSTAAQLATDSTTVQPARPKWQMLRTTLNTIVVGCMLWASPIIVVALWSPDSILLSVGLFFSQLAVVTFGGAYALLAYLGQEVVGVYGWLSTQEMMDGLGLAETTPGPLILVTEFVGFLAGFREGGFTLALLSTFMTLWVTFVPCFLWIFAGAPYLEWISDQPRLKNGLSMITAAVVGVMLNLAVWFAFHVWFGEVHRYDLGLMGIWFPEYTTVNPVALVLTIVCAILVFIFQWGVIATLAAASALACILSLLA